MKTREIPARVRELYDEQDALWAILDDPWSTGDARARAVRDMADVEAALTNRQA